MISSKGRSTPSGPKPIYKYIVSACLAGINCKYDGKNNLKKEIKQLVDKEALPVCPEALGGLPTPRANSEIVGGDGSSVLRKKARVITTIGEDETENFISGAKAVLGLAKKYGIKKAILKSRSPSCGAGQIYDGTFKGALRKGDGVLAALLRKNNIKIYTEEDYADA